MLLSPLELAASSEVSRPGSRRNRPHAKRVKRDGNGSICKASPNGKLHRTGQSDSSEHYLPHYYAARNAGATASRSPPSAKASYSSTASRPHSWQPSSVLPRAQEISQYSDFYAFSRAATNHMQDSRFDIAQKLPATSTQQPLFSVEALSHMTFDDRMHSPSNPSSARMSLPFGWVLAEANTEDSSPPPSSIPPPLTNGDCSTPETQHDDSQPRTPAMDDLVGMGLYEKTQDCKTSPFPDLEPIGSLSPGKGLKLEETFDPAIESEHRYSADCRSLYQTIEGQSIYDTSSNALLDPLSEMHQLYSDGQCYGFSSTDTMGLHPDYMAQFSHNGNRPHWLSYQESMPIEGIGRQYSW